MTDTQTMPVLPRLISVSQLIASTLNVRQTRPKTGMDELKASLLAHGLLQNLVVTEAPDDTYRVIAGGRRLEAIRLLQAEGKLPDDFSVPCQVVTEDHATEMSLAENTVRLAMHPADQFEAFVALIDKGESAADVARRFGIEESLVLKRMKLARVAPQLLTEYRNEAFSLECLMAFTITDDHRRQLKVFKSLHDWQKNDPGAIRSALTEKMVEAGSKLALFVGLEAYQAAGGSIRADLFGEEVYLEKPALLNKLAEKKLENLRRELEAGGWGWIEINPDRDWNLVNRCNRLKPSLMGAPTELLDLKSSLDAELADIEEAMQDSESDELNDRQEVVQRQLDEIEEKLAAYVGFDIDQMSLAGCFVSIGQDGTPFIDKGLVRPEHRRQLAKLLGTDDREPVKAKSKNAFPESLCRDLATERLHIAQVELARHPAIAFDLLVFHAASDLLGEPTLFGPDISFKHSPSKPGTDHASSIASMTLKAVEEALPTDWLKGSTEAARFEAFRSLPEADKLRLLAYVVALTSKPKLASAGGDDATAYDITLSLTSADVSSYWRPTRSNFLGRITRDQLLAIGRDVLGDAWAQSRSGEKKSSLVDQLDRAFSNPEAAGRNSGQVEKLKRWLPPCMTFEVAAPSSAKSRKRRQAA